MDGRAGVQIPKVLPWWVSFLTSLGPSYVKVGGLLKST